MSAALLSQGGAGGFSSEPVTQFEREGKKSGYLFATPETQKMQADDFENPAFLWVEHGEQLWTKVEGSEGKSCASCHGAAASMRGIGATYPKVSKETGKLFALEHQINYCRTERMKAPESGFDAMDPANIAPLVVWLGSAESKDVTGRVFELAGGEISLADGWRTGPRVDKGARWEPDEVGAAVADLLRKAVAPQKVYGA